MQTTCPECRTAFRVTQEQLGLRRGLVRCGGCNAVFNAYDTLLPELAEPPIQPKQPVLDALSDNATLPELTMPEWLDRIPPPPPAPAPEPAPAEVEAEPEAPTAQEPGATPAPEETPETILLSELPNRRTDKAPLPAWKKVLYGLAILFLLVLLLLQLALFLRADLVAALPRTRPALEFLCAPLGCEVPLPRQLTKSAITASNLEHDPEQKSRVRLTFMLTNRSGQTQAWPHITLTLTDVREAPVAQKLFPPEVYLPRGGDIAAGMADGSEREVRLDLDIGNLAATGYALNPVYP